MKDYLEPDKRWEQYKFSGQEDYIEKVVIEGYFHEQVPEDVIKAYTTSEYLMAYAYYHWEMFDEALKKCLFTLEMAIKLKAQEKGIALKTKRKGKKYDRRLVDIIDDVCSGEYMNNLKIYFHKARGLRNHFAHPIGHHFSGPHGTSTYITHIVNVLNRLFKNDEWHERYAKKTDAIGRQLNALTKKVLKVEDDKNPAFLISRFHRFELVDDHLILSVIPVLNKYEVSDKGFTGDQVKVYSIFDFQINENEISGILENGVKIRISVTNNRENQRALIEYMDFLNQLSEEQTLVQSESLEYNTSIEMAKEEYLYWKKKFG